MPPLIKSALQMLAATALASACGSAAAQDAPATDNVAGDIIVTGRGIDQAPEQRGYDVIVIDQSRLASTASHRLEDALADIAGLASFRRSDSRSANPTSQGITLRGIGGNAASRALLILDGVPQQDPFAGWVAFPAYDPARLARVRVTRGGGSAIWGPGAETGTVELDSLVPDRAAPVTAGMAYGSRDSVDASLTGALIRSGGFATISAAYQRGDGFAPIVAADRGLVDRAAPYEQTSIALRSVIQIGAASELQAALQGFSDRRDRGLDFTANRSEGVDASVRLVGGGRGRWSLLGYVQTRNFASQFASVNEARTVVSPTLDQYAVPATGIGGRVDVSLPVWRTLTVRAGGDVRALSGETRELFSYVSGRATRRRVAGGSTRTAGAYADIALSIGSLSVDVNGRVDSWSISGGHLLETVLATGTGAVTSRSPDRTGWEPTGRVGFGWKPANALTLRAAVYRGWRLPTLNELYRPFRAGADATAANSALKPEHLSGGEVGIDWRPLPRASLSVTVFDNRLDQAISNVTIARGPINCPGVGIISAAGSCRRRDNIDAIRAQGIEVDASIGLGSVAARASYAFTDPRITATGIAAPLDGLMPAQVPAHQASATIDWAPRPQAHMALTARYSASQFEDDLNARRLRGAFTLDSTIAVPIGKRVTVEARAENLFDAVVDTGFSNSARERSHPRTLWIGMRLTAAR